VSGIAEDKHTHCGNAALKTTATGYDRGWQALPIVDFADGVDPGKTAPRLVADICATDVSIENVYNPFKNIPPSIDPHPHRYSSVSPCVHSFTIKPTQSHIDRDSPHTKVAAICQHCRYHVDADLLRGSSQNSTSSKKAGCASTGNPLHFFSPEIAAPPNPQSPEAILGRNKYEYRCINCMAKATIHFRPPRLTDEYATLLTDRDHLALRHKAAILQDSARPGMEVQPGHKALEALSSYVKDALSTDKPARAIPKFNKRFMLSLGEDCAPLLRWLGYRESVSSEGEQIWNPPKPQLPDPFGAPEATWQRILLEDVLEEVYAMLRSYSVLEQRSLKNPPPSTEPAEPALQKIFGADLYERNSFGLRSNNRADDVNFAGLGILADFPAQYIIWAFRQQVERDPANAFFYYDSFYAITQLLQNEDLDIELGILASEGYVGQEYLREAYRCFALDWATDIADEQIMGLFQSRMESSARDREAELRQHLAVIARHRQSANLSDAAENGKWSLFFCPSPRRSSTPWPRKRTCKHPTIA
jgi:hypothetical protein